MQDAESRIQDVDCRKDDAGCEILDVCTNAHEVRSTLAINRTENKESRLEHVFALHLTSCRMHAGSSEGCLHTLSKKCKSRWSGSRLQDTNGNCKMQVAWCEMQEVNSLDATCRLQKGGNKGCRLQEAGCKYCRLPEAGFRGFQAPRSKMQRLQIPKSKGESLQVA